MFPGTTKRHTMLPKPPAGHPLRLRHLSAIPWRPPMMVKGKSGKHARIKQFHPYIKRELPRCATTYFNLYIKLELFFKERIFSFFFFQKEGRGFPWEEISFYLLGEDCWGNSGYVDFLERKCHLNISSVRGKILFFSVNRQGGLFYVFSRRFRFFRVNS